MLFGLLALPLVMLVGVGIYIPFLLYDGKKGMKRRLGYHLFRYFFIVTMCMILYLTILWDFPAITFHPTTHHLNLKPFGWIKRIKLYGFTRIHEQLVLNVLMFIPFGVLLPAVSASFRRWWKVFLTSLVFTISIETLQYFIGRSADIDDVVMNFAGGFVGWFFYVGLSYLWKKTHSVQERETDT